MANMTNHTKLRTKDLRSGTVLAEDIRDRSGRLLLPAGLTVRENHVRIMKAWGITEITIIMEGDSVELAEDEAAVEFERLDPQIVERAEAKMADIFRHADLRHPFMRELHALSVQRLARELMKEGGM